MLSLAPWGYLHQRRRHRQPGAGCWRRRCSGSTLCGRSDPLHSDAPSHTRASYRRNRCRCHPGSGERPFAEIPGDTGHLGKHSSVLGLPLTTTNTSDGDWEFRFRPQSWRPRRLLSAACVTACTTARSAGGRLAPCRHPHPAGAAVHTTPEGQPATRGLGPGSFHAGCSGFAVGMRASGLTEWASFTNRPAQ